MTVDIISLKGSSLSFVLKDVSVSMANAIRRTVLGEVYSLAVEEVEYYNNTSSLYDEILAHRLSLIPVRADLSLLNPKEKCSCKEGCPSCEVEFSLKKKGPGVVYSDDIKPPNKKFVPVKGVPIVKLGKNQEVELKATAILGRGKEHSRWQPAVVGYKYYPIIEISDECTNCEACAEACPQGIFEIKQKKLKIIDEKECILCMSCVEACKTGAIDVRGDENRFIYQLESTNSLEPLEILVQACDAIAKKAESLASML